MPSKFAQTVDDVIGFVSPGWALRRAQARCAIEQVRRYEAASYGRRMSGWNASGASPDENVRADLRTLRNRSREATENNCWMRSAVNAIQTDLVGTGIALKIKGSDRKAAKVLMAKWKAWSETKACDFRGTETFAALQSIGARAMIESGEFLVRRVFTDDTAAPMKLLCIEADQLDTTLDGQVLDSGNYVVQGVEYSPLGQRVAYHIWKRHPGTAMQGLEQKPERVLASEILHVFETLRFGQTRGIPRGTACLVRLRDFDEYEDAQAVRQKVAACFVGFVHDMTNDADMSRPSVIGQASDATASDSSSIPRKFTPGLWQYLPPGKSISFGTPPKVDGYTEYSDITLHGVAQAMEVTYERLTGDLSKVNFSSAKAGATKYHASLDRLLWLHFIPKLCDPVFRWFLEANWEADSAVEWTWTAPGRPLVDPVREIPAQIDAVRAGFKTRGEVCREMGYDREDIDEERKEELESAAAMGLEFTTDVPDPDVPAAPPPPGGDEDNDPTDDETK